MSSALSMAGMTREAFLAWQPPDDRRYEFDGFAPVAMTGGTVSHSRVCQNIWSALRSRLGDGPCETLGPDAGVQTVGEAIRYPDALVTCTKSPGTARTVAGVVVVFEVLSPTSGRTDRIEKLREYRAVPSILQYVILESRSAALTLLERAPGVMDWTARSLVIGDVLSMPALGIEVPVAEFYQRVDFAAQDGLLTAETGEV